MWGRKQRGHIVEQRTTTQTFSPSQAVSVVIGVFAIVLGAAALIETGVNTADWTSRHAAVFGLHHTSLLAVAEIGFGALMLLAAALGPFVGRALSALLSTGLLVLGVFVVADFHRARFHDALGVHDANGWLFIVVGGVGFVASVLMPVVRTTKATTVREVAAPRAEATTAADATTQTEDTSDDAHTGDDTRHDAPEPVTAEAPHSVEARPRDVFPPRPMPREYHPADS